MSLLLKLFSPPIKSGDSILKKAQYNEEGYYVHSSNRNQSYPVTVVVPVYNAEKTLRRAIDSVINQSIGFDNIELILIDDKSTDSSREIILEYARRFRNIVPVFFKKNNGSPAIPRNVGIDLATGEYIKFMDADDWLTSTGIETLYHLLVKTGDPYAIGRTIKAENGRFTITGEYNSCENRNSIHPCSIPHVFQHLGPTARMMKTQFVREYNCRFPNMRYAEDKQFFIDILTNCPTISTSKEVIYYVNRDKENKSLVSRTSIFEKTDTNIAVIKYVINKNLPEHVERMILNRLYEFDCITRLFNRQLFLKSPWKDRYYKKFAEVLETTNDLRYDFTENFFEPWHKILVDLYKEGRYADLVRLIDWSLNNHMKDIVIEDGLPYYMLPFEEPYNVARINVMAVYHTSIRASDHLKLYINIYGDPEYTINSLVIRERVNHLNEVELPIRQVDEHLHEVLIPYDRIGRLSTSSYQVYVKYNQYRKLMIKMNTRNIISYNKKVLDFYTTIGDNYGLNVK